MTHNWLQRCFVLLWLGQAGSVAFGAVAALGPPRPSIIQKNGVTGPIGNPTGGGITAITAMPSPVTAGSAVRFTIQGWGACSSLRISYGDAETFNGVVFFDVDFTETGNYQTTRVYKNPSTAGQPYMITATVLPEGPKPCNSQVSTRLDVKAVSAAQQPGAVSLSAPAKVTNPAAKTENAAIVSRESAIVQAVPTITGVWTAGVRPGEIVNVVGTGFGSQRGRVRLIRDGNQLGDIFLEITDWKDQFVQGRVPANYPANDTAVRGLQVFNSQNQGSNLWSVHSGVVIEEVALVAGAPLIKISSCPKEHCWVESGRTFSLNATHTGSGVSSGDSGTDSYSFNLANGWRLHSCQYTQSPKGVDGGIRGCQAGLTQGTLSVRWFYDAGAFPNASYGAVVTIVGPKGIQP